jgi:hypothetical protein
LVSTLCLCGHSSWFFPASAHDLALFVHMSPCSKTLLLLYVDDAKYIAFVKVYLSDQFLMSILVL